MSNELIELHRLTGGPDAAWSALRCAVIRLDNERRRIERAKPRFTDSTRVTLTPFSEIQSTPRWQDTEHFGGTPGNQI